MIKSYGASQIGLCLDWLLTLLEQKLDVPFGTVHKFMDRFARTRHIMCSDSIHDGAVQRQCLKRTAGKLHGYLATGLQGDPERRRQVFQEFVLARGKNRLVKA